MAANLLKEVLSKLPEDVVRRTLLSFIFVPIALIFTIFFGVRSVNDLFVSAYGDIEIVAKLNDSIKTGDVIELYPLSLEQMVDADKVLFWTVDFDLVALRKIELRKIFVKNSKIMRQTFASQQLSDKPAIIFNMRSQ